VGDGRGKEKELKKRGMSTVVNNNKVDQWVTSPKGDMCGGKWGRGKQQREERNAVWIIQDW